MGKIYEQPSEVNAKDGVVEVRSPDAGKLRMTADAADETADRLLRAARQARQQAAAMENGSRSDEA